MGQNSSNFDNYEYDHHQNSNNLSLEQLNHEILLLKDKSSNYVLKSDYTQEKAGLVKTISELKNRLKYESSNYVLKSDYNQEKYELSNRISNNNI